MKRSSSLSLGCMHELGWMGQMLEYHVNPKVVAKVFFSRYFYVFRNKFNVSDNSLHLQPLGVGAAAALDRWRYCDGTYSHALSLTRFEAHHPIEKIYATDLLLILPSIYCCNFFIR